MLTQVADWLELTVWQLAVGLLSAARPLRAGVQRAAQHVQDAQAQRRAHALRQPSQMPAAWLAAPSLLQRLSDNWTVVAVCGWLLGLALGAWLAGW